MRPSNVKAVICVGDGLIVVVWVDDILLIGKEIAVQQMKLELTYCVEIKDLGPLETGGLLVMKVTRKRQRGQLQISQSAYIEEVLKQFSLSEANGARTPIESGAKFHKRLANDRKASNRYTRSSLAVSTMPQLALVETYYLLPACLEAMLLARLESMQVG
jgi:hypothetical protein